MGLLDKLFNRKKKIGDRDINIDRKTGEIRGSFDITVNGKVITIPIKTSVEQLELESKRKEDPNSCEREPNEDEVKLPVDYDIRIVACDDTETIFNLMQKASLRGYNNFVVPRTILEQALKEFEMRQERDERMCRTAALNNKGIAAEKEGRIEEAISIYKQSINTGYPARHAFTRLAIIYHKQKDYNNERRVLEDMQKVFGNDAWAGHRLSNLNNTEP